MLPKAGTPSQLKRQPSLPLFSNAATTANALTQLATLLKCGYHSVHGGGAEG